MPGSKIFVGYRALGFHCNHVPLKLRYIKKHREHYVVTIVGKAFHQYNVSRMGITTVSNSHPHDITCLAVDGRFVYTGCKNVVRAFSTRLKEVVAEFDGHNADVHLLLPFGDHLVTVDQENVLRVWDVKSKELYLEVSYDNPSFSISALFHPTTYLNKVLLASHQGPLQLWNIKSNKLIYTFNGWNSPVTALEQSPAVDVVAIGLASGKIVLHNLKFDETVMEFMQDWGPVVSLSFRTDGHPVLASGSTLGHIALWDLEERRLLSQMREAHSTAVTGLEFVQSEPLLVTGASDNALKVWIMDQPDGSGRLLRCRLGHYAPPNKIRFHGNDGKNILSAGQDSTLKSFSTVHDKHNKNLGQASMNRALAKKRSKKYDLHKMTPIIDFASEVSRQSEWDGIMACHHSCATATSWNYQKSSMGKHKIKRAENDVAKCVTVSSCGNFSLVGWRSGHVDMYNIQSGIHRGSYGQPTAHNGSVCGVQTDGLNRLTITASTDSTLKFWKFKEKDLLQTIGVEAPVSQILLHRDSCMLAVALIDFTVSIIDIEARKVVRNFSGHKNRITDMAFSPNGHWLITSSMDSTVCTWDLPVARMVDCFAVDPPVTSLSMSPTAEFLATSHVDDLGVYLWSNQTLYAHVSLRPLPEGYRPSALQLPGTHHLDAEQEEGAEAVCDDSEDEVEEEEFKSPEQISEELITLSTLPQSRWLNLTKLDIIKMRNKPKEPPKIPKSAPFFLPTVAGLQPKFSQPEIIDEKGEGKVKIVPTQLLSEFGSLLQMDISTPAHYDSLLEKLKGMSPSAIDLELRSLGPLGGGNTQLLLNFLQLILHMLKSNSNFELAQAYLGLFLKLHGQTMVDEPESIEGLDQVAREQEKSWLRLQSQLNQSLCLINYFKSAVL